MRTEVNRIITQVTISSVLGMLGVPQLCVLLINPLIQPVPDATSISRLLRFQGSPDFSARDSSL